MTLPFFFAAERRFGGTDYQRWVLSSALVAAVGYTVSTGAGYRVYHEASPMQLATALLCWAAFALAYVGRPTLAAVLVLGSVWAEINYGVHIATDFPGAGLLVAPVYVAGAGLLLGRFPSLLLALATVAVSTPIVMSSPAWLAGADHGRIVYWMVLHAICTMATWSIVSLGMWSLERALATARAKEAELADTIRLAPDGIVVVDADERVVAINPAARVILGAVDAQCFGRPLGDVLGGAQSTAQTTAEFGAMLGADHSLEAPLALAIHRPDGARAFVEVTWRRMSTDRRQLSLRDVSERVRAEESRRGVEEQLAHAQRLEAIGQLAGGIAHDFNNLLTAVAGAAELLRDELGSESHDGLLDEILAAQERGAGLTKQLLAFARRDIVQPKVFDLSVQVGDLQRLLHRVGGEQMQVVCDLEPDCRVRADVGQMEQALVNLVTNARDAMPDGGLCTVRCQRTSATDGSRWVALTVTDSGIGMDEVALAHAFEPFFTTKPRGSGTGLGLASVHGIVMQSGGRARIDSTPLRGTTVTLEFPLASGLVEATPGARAADARPAGTATILVAEDDDGTRGVIDRILQRAGYRVLLAPDGVAAIRMAEKHRGAIDLLLSDVMMPGLSGPQLAERLGVAQSGLPVIFMSGYPEDALDGVPGFQIARDFLPKPFSSTLLLQRVHDTLQRGARGASAPRPAP